MSPGRRAAVILLVVALVAAAGAVLTVNHPLAWWSYGAAQKSDVPPILGPGLILVPLILLAVAIRWAWGDLTLRLEAHRQRRLRKRRPPRDSVSD